MAGREVFFAAAVDDQLWEGGYKRIAGTKDYAEQGYKSDLEYFHQSMTDFQSKVDEQNSKLESLYPATSSGHVDESGLYQPGHKKRRKKEAPLKSNEVIIRKCCEVKPSAYLLPVDQCNGFSELSCWFSGIQDVQEKSADKFKHTPLLVYRSNKGFLGDSGSLQELNITLPELISGCQIFDKFTKSTAYDSGNIFRLITQTLPLKTWLRLLSTPPDEVKNLYQGLPEEWQAAVASQDWPLLIAYLDRAPDSNIKFLYNGHSFNILAYILDQIGPARCADILAGKEQNLLKDLQSIAARLSVPQWVEPEFYTCNGSVDISIVQALLIPEAIPPSNELLRDLTDCMKYITEYHLRGIAQTIINALPPGFPASLLDCCDHPLDKELTFVLNNVDLQTDDVSGEYHPVMQLINAGAGIVDSFWDDHIRNLSWNFKGKKLLNDLKAMATAPEQAAKRLATNEAALRRVSEMAETEPCQKSFDPQGLKPSGYQWLQPLFEHTLSPDSRWSYTETSQAVVRHYYQRPHALQLKRVLNGTADPECQKANHGADHVTRTQIYAEASIELFKNYAPFDQLLEKHSKLPEVLPLALLYHDVYAEVGKKEDEEPVAANYFLKDMQAQGKYPEHTLQLVASALYNKNTNIMPVVQSPFVADNKCTEQERLMRCLVRLPDSIDVMRIFPPGKAFPKPEQAGKNRIFNSGMLDLPADLRANENFMNKLHAFLQGARDLCGISGGAPIYSGVGMGKDTYPMEPKKYNKMRRQKVERSANTRATILEMLDENVKRRVAQLAGLTACEDSHNKLAIQEGHRPSCLPMEQGRVRPIFRKIHNEMDLKEVNLPAMSTLHKFMFGYMGDELFLDEGTRQLLAKEIDRLKESGIPVSDLAMGTVKSHHSRKRSRKL